MREHQWEASVWYRILDALRDTEELIEGVVGKRYGLAEEEIASVEGAAGG
jgi:hypothetical protein